MASAASTEYPSAAREKRHRLANGVQVRAERKGLLFYCRRGPRLYYLSCGKLLSPAYFGSEQSIGQWLLDAGIEAAGIYPELSGALADLVQKEVLIAD